MKKRILESMQNADDIKLSKVSKRARVRGFEEGLRKKILDNAKKINIERPKKHKKSVTMVPEKIILLQTLSEEFKIPQGEVIEKLLDIAADDYFKDKFHEKLKNRFI